MHSYRSVLVGISSASGGFLVLILTVLLIGHIILRVYVELWLVLLVIIRKPRSNCLFKLLDVSPKGESCWPLCLVIARTELSYFQKCLTKDIFNLEILIILGWLLDEISQLYTEWILIHFIIGLVIVVTVDRKSLLMLLLLFALFAKNHIINLILEVIIEIVLSKLLFLFLQLFIDLADELLITHILFIAYDLSIPCLKGVILQSTLVWFLRACSTA